MIEYLLQVEKRLPKLLQSMNGWCGRMVTYEKPHVERLFRQDGENRIYLHRIHPCMSIEAFQHRHPWPSAMRLVSGVYKMRMWVTDEEGRELPFGSTTLCPGSAYEMINPASMHCVQPLVEPTLSVMVTGPVWSKEAAKTQVKNPDLSRGKCDKLLKDFQYYYPA